MAECEAEQEQYEKTADAYKSAAFWKSQKGGSIDAAHKAYMDANDALDRCVRKEKTWPIHTITQSRQ